MHVLLLQLDGKIPHPNRALMQIAGHHRAAGDEVTLRIAKTATDLQPQLGDPDWGRIYGSLIFERSRPMAALAQRVYPGLELGGTGWDFEGGVMLRRTELPDGAADAPADYSIYPDIAYSMGFTHRGCRKACDFCVVPRKEGKIRSVGTLHDLWRGEGHPKQIVLLDNDFFGNPAWRDVIAEAIEYEFELAVIQGINARSLTKEQAAAVASVPWKAGDFSRTRVYVAWDDENDGQWFFRGVERLKAAGISPDSMMVYMLIGHAEGETHEDRDRRRARIRAFGARPYPMPYVRDGELGAELRAFNKWCVHRADLHIPWEVWWGKAKGEPRKLAKKRVTLPLFRGDDNGEDDLS